jgi:hypothetical protein
MAVLVPIRSDNSYFGWAKETTPGIPVAPSIFPRWMDGSSVEIDLAAGDIWEGDGSRRLSLIVKNRQMVKIKVAFTPRANELGYFENACMGAGSDSYVAPAVNTTLSSGTLVGATSITVASNTGLTGTGTIALVIGAGTTSEEIAIFTLPATGGSAPYTLTVSNTYNGGALKQAHTSGSTAQSPAQHFLTDQTDGNYYTIEVALGSLYGAGGTTLRVRTCKCESIKRSGKAGDIIRYEMEWIGIAASVQSMPATVTLEPHLPFLFTQGLWAIDGSTSSNDSLAIEMFDIEQKNNMDTAIQTEQLTLAALIFGTISVGFSCDIVYTNAQKIYQTYFGSTSGITDSQNLGLGSFSVTFTQPDTFQSVTYYISTVAYTKVSLPQPKKDGKHMKLQISGTSIAAPLSGSGPNNMFVLQTVVSNTQYASY